MRLCILPSGSAAGGRVGGDRASRSSMTSELIPGSALEVGEPSAQGVGAIARGDCREEEWWPPEPLSVPSSDKAPGIEGRAAAAPRRPPSASGTSKFLVPTSRGGSRRINAVESTASGSMVR
jgi:hypothetical protein